VTTTTIEPRTAPEVPLARTAPTAGLVTSTLSIARRTILKFLRTPQLAVVGTIQGAMFLLIFRYVFGGAISSGGLSYVDFLVPGFITTGVLFGGMGAAAGVAEDLQQGVVDRLRSLPIARSAVLAGRAVADTALQAWSLAITIGIGFLVGFRLHGSLGQAILAFFICLACGFAFLWLFICLGLVSGSAQAAQGTSYLIYPLIFVSSAYVPVNTLPGWMQPIAEHQPITVMANAVRSLALGDPALAGLGHTTSYWVSLSLIWSAALVVVLAPVAVVLYRRAS
jgi:ABC transporter DrrB family efflux protein